MYSIMCIITALLIIEFLNNSKCTLSDHRKMKDPSKNYEIFYHDEVKNCDGDTPLHWLSNKTRLDSLKRFMDINVSLSIDSV